MADKKIVKLSLRKAVKGVVDILPLLVGVILLTSFLSKAIPSSFYVSFLGRGPVWDAFWGNILGSIGTGNPVLSYVLGGELLNKGISLMAVTAFLIAWGTVALAQLPVESKVLGKKFALLRNLLTFIFVFVVSLATIAILSLI